MGAIKDDHLFDPKKIEILEQEDRKTWLNLEEILEKVHALLEKFVLLCAKCLEVFSFCSIGQHNS